MALDNADIRLLVGVARGGADEGNSEELIRNELSDIMKSINKNPMRVVVKLSGGQNGKSFRKQIQDQIDSINNSEKLAVKISKMTLGGNAINDFKRQISSILGTLNLEKGTTITLNADGIGEIKRKIQDVGTEAATSKKEVDSLNASIEKSREAARKAAEAAVAMRDMQSGLTRAKGLVDFVKKNGTNDLDGKGTDAIKTREKEIVTLSTKYDVLRIRLETLRQEEQNGVAVSEERRSALRADIDALIENAAALKKNATGTAQANKEEKLRSDEIRKGTKLIQEITKAEEKWTKAKSGKSSANYARLAALRQELDELIQKYSEATIKKDEFEKEYSRISGEFASIRGAIHDAGEDTKTFGERIGGLVSKFGIWLNVSQVVMKLYNAMRKMVRAVIEIDTAMTELKKVTDETDATYRKFLDGAAARAKALGATMADTVNATADFARLGYSIDDATKLADAAIIYKNVGDGIDSISAASESIISTMKAFKIEANDAMSIVDKFNKVGNEFAISSTGIGEALQRSAAALASTGSTLEESIAMIVGMNNVVQDPDVVGTTIKTVSMYMRAAKTDAEDAGIATDGMANSVSELRDELLKLTGVDINIDDHTFKPLYQQLKEISEVFNTLEESDTKRGAILELLGGKRGASSVASLLTNWQDVEAAYNAAMNAEGSALAENTKYLNSAQGYIDKFKATFEELSTNFVGSDLVKGFVEFGRVILIIVNGIVKLINAFGGLKTALLGIAATLVVVRRESIRAMLTAETFQKIKLFFVNGVGKIVNAVKRIIPACKAAAVAWKGYAAGTVSASSAMQASIPVIGLVLAALTMLIGTLSLVRSKQDEANQAAIDAANKVADENSELTELIFNYAQLSEQIDLAESSTSDLEGSKEKLIDSMQLEKNKLDELISKYGNYSDAMKAAAAQKLEADAVDIASGVEAAREDVLDYGSDVSRGNVSFGSAFSDKGNWSALGAQTPAEILSSKRVIGITLNTTSKNSSEVDAIKEALRTLDESGFDAYYAPLLARVNLGKFDTDDVGSIISLYERLGDAIRILNDSGNTTNALFGALSEKYAEMGEVVGKYTGLIEEQNNNVAQQYVINGLIGRTIPATADEFEAYKKEVIDAAVASGKFVGSEEDIKSAIDGVLSKQPEFYRFYKNQATTATSTANTVKNLRVEYSKLSEAVSNAVTAQLSKSDVFADNTYISEEMYKAIAALAGGEDNIADAVNTTNGYLVTNAELLNKIIDESTETTKQNLKLAQSHEKMNYHELVKQLGDVLNSMESYDDATADAVKTLSSQIDATKTQIAQYAMLEQRILGVANAYTQMENAKAIDDAADYLDDTSSILQDLFNSYKNKEFGTEQFWTAFRAFVPTDVYEQFEDVGDQIDAGWKYINGKMSKYYNMDNDKVSMGFDQVKEFVNNALNTSYGNSTVFTGTIDDFQINPQIKSVEQLADAMGTTTTMAFALGNGISKYTLDNEDFLSALSYGVQTFTSEESKIIQEYSRLISNGSISEEKLSAMQEIADKYGISVDEVLNDYRDIDGQAYATDQKMADLLKHQEELARAGKIGTQEWEDTRAAINAAGDDLEQLGKRARESIADNIDIDSKIESAQEKVDSLYKQLQSNPNVKAAYAEAENELASLLQKKYALEEPTELTIRVATDQIQSELDEAEKKLNEIATFDGKTYTAKYFVDQSDVDALVEKVESLRNEKMQIEDYVGFEGEDVLDTLQVVEDFKIHNKGFSVTANFGNTIWGLEYITSLLNNVNGRSVSANVYAADGHGAKRVPFKTTAEAYVSGTLGTKTAEKGSLVGELGPELYVDPKTGTYQTVGDNGAELIDLPKGAIIFNHKQTEEILKYKRINSRGQAYLNGNAHFKLSDGNYGGSSGGGSGGSSGSGGNDNSSDFVDWIKIAIDRIERAINRLSTIASSTFKTLATRIGATNDELSKVAQEIKIQQAGYERYLKQADSVGLSSDLKERVRNGAIDINEYDDETRNLISEYQNWYEAAIDCSDAILTLRENIASLYESKFNNIATDYENQLSLMEHLTTTYNNGLDDLEERGYLASTKYYESLRDVESRNIALLKQELSDLTTSMSEAVNSGAVSEGSEAWYEMQGKVNSTKEALQEAETSVISFSNSIRELNWEHFDYLQERISAITDEADFLSKLIENSTLYSDNGQLTSTGMATMGLHGQSYNVYMAQADKYAQEIKKINAEIANDPNNTKLLERREELLKAQRDSILAANDEKQAIVDMVKEGIDLELSALKELIDSYTDALDSAKDLYDYQKKIGDQTSEIAKLQKQLAAYSGDTSEESRATIQKLQVDLSDAMDNLQETQYEHYISDQKKLLDDMYDEYETVLNQRLDNVDALIGDMIDTINANSVSISDTLVAESEKVGYDISDSIQAIWSNDGGAYSIIAKYGDAFTDYLTSVNAVLNSIAINVASMISSSDTAADTTIGAASESTAADSSVTPPTSIADTTQPTNPSNNSASGGGDATLTDKDYYGIALAIWNGGYGWGTGQTRVDRLKSKGFDVSKVQSVVNQLGRDGYVHNGAWVGKYYGIRDLSQYHYNRYLHGGLVDYTGLAQLDGTPSEPEMVLDHKDTSNFIALKDAMRSIANSGTSLSSLFNGKDVSAQVLEQLSRIDAPRLFGTTPAYDITYNVNIPIDHVTDYDDFMNQMRRDGKFEKMVQSMTIDRIVGGSKLAKNKYQW